MYNNNNNNNNKSIPLRNEKYGAFTGRKYTIKILFL